MSQETEGGASAFQHVLDECHRWQLVVPVHEPGQEPKWRLQDPEKLDSARRDVVMMTQAFIAGHRVLFDGYCRDVLKPANASTQHGFTSALVDGMNPNNDKGSALSTDLEKLARAIGQKIPALGDQVRYLVALEYTGTVDLSKLEKESQTAGDNGKKKPGERTMADDVDELFDGVERIWPDWRSELQELKDTFREWAEETRRGAAKARDEAERDAKAAKAEVDAAVNRFKERTRAAWPRIRAQVDSWLAEKPPKS